MIGRITRITAFILFSGFLLSCAAQSSQTRSSVAQAPEIQDIRVTEGHGKTIIEIEGEEAMIYTTFRLTDPNRLIIDIADMGLGTFDQEIQLENGPIRAIRPVSGGGSNVTRLELLLDEGSEAGVSSDGANLVIDAVEAGRMKSQFVFFDTASSSPEKSEAISEADPAGEGGFEEGINLSPAISAASVNESAVLSAGGQVIDPALKQKILEDGSDTDTSAEALESNLETDKLFAPENGQSSFSASESLPARAQDMGLLEDTLSGETIESVSTAKGLAAPSEFASEGLMNGATEPPPLLPMSSFNEPEDAEPEPSLDKAIEEIPAETFEDSTQIQTNPLANPKMPVEMEDTEGVSLAQEPLDELLSSESARNNLATSVNAAPPVEKPLPIAKRVTAIHFEKAGDLRLIVSLDGILRPRIFRVDQKRIAIDLPGVKTGLKQTKIPADDPLVKQVRIGVHASKLRLVVDLAAKASYSWEQKQGVLEVTFRDPAAAPEKQARPEAPVQESEELPDLSLPSPSPVLEKNLAEDLLITAPLSPLPGLDTSVLDTPVVDTEEILPEPAANQKPETPKLVENAHPKPSKVASPAREETDIFEEETDIFEIEDEVIAAPPPPLTVNTGKMLAGPVKNQSLEAPDTLSAPAPLVVPVVSNTQDDDLEADSKEENLLEEAQTQDEKKTENKQKERARKKTFLRQRREKKAGQEKNLFVQKQQIEEDLLEFKKPKYTGKKISLDFQDAEITNVIRLIADVSRLNFVMGEDVAGKISLKLSSVPWDQALDIILEMNSLGQVRQGNIVRITTLVNLAKQRSEAAKAKETQVNSADLLTRVIYVNYGKAGEAKALLEKLLSPRGEMMFDKRTNAIIVKDVETNLLQIEGLSRKLDTKTPQVLIEARVAEVKPSFKKSLGVQWGADFKTTRGGNILGVGNAAAGSAFNGGTPDFAVNLPASNNLGGVGFTFGRFSQSPFTLDLRLSAGEVQEMTRIVSTPKIMVLDNHEAKIEQGQSIPFQTSSDNGGTKTEFIDAKLTLKVTPHISPDGGILLDVLLTKNEPALTTEVGAPGPRIFKKEVSTKILLMDGETMVIGGIYQTQKSKSESGVPWLKDLPVIGWLFKNKEEREETSELLVFITPTVME